MKNSLIIASGTIILATSILFILGVEKSKKDLHFVYSSHIEGKVEYIKDVKGSSRIGIGATEYRFVANLSIEDRYIFNSLVQKGDSIYKLSNNDTIYVHKSEKIHTFTLYHPWKSNYF